MEVELSLWDGLVSALSMPRSFLFLELAMLFVFII
jgi:hypothetical protein